MKKGQIHIYTGDGKGKTTAALGLALRSLGAGQKVAIIQFMKRANYSEHKAIKKFKLPILIKSFGIGYYKILGDNKPKSNHLKAARKALMSAQELIKSKKYDLIILDEINVAIDFGLIGVNDVIDILVTNNGVPVTVILTGRRAHPKLKKIADLVTEMKKIKHPFDKGLKAQKGIEY
jgi:cob(I)alamin adenosyltransferase